MKNPYLLAWAFNIAVFGAVWIYIRLRFRLPFRFYIAIAATCMPVPIYVAGYFFFVGDVVGTVLLAAYLLRRGLGGRQSNNFAPSVVGLYSVGLIAWPLLSTYFSITHLNETAQPSNVGFFIIRSAAQLGFFSWAARIGAAVPSVKPLLSIPAAFWMLFAVLGMLQFAGAIDVDAFWYLNSDSKHLYTITSGFMGMDKPQLALWSSYGTCIALWLAAIDWGLLGFAALGVPVLSIVTVLAIGSRQGLFGVALANISTPLFMALKSVRRLRLMRVGLALMAILAVGPFVWNGIDAGRREFMMAQFDQLEIVSSVDELATKRDSTTLPLIRYITDEPQRLYFGSGVGTESGGESAFGSVHTYAEGEYLRILWSGGLVSLGFYAVVLMIFLVQGLRGLRCDPRFQQGEGALLLSITIVGVFFAFGQFHLFTTIYHNVPCNYLLMMASGLLGGAVTRSCAASNTVRVSGHKRGMSTRCASGGLRLDAVRRANLSPAGLWFSGSS